MGHAFKNEVKKQTTNAVNIQDQTKLALICAVVGRLNQLHADECGATSHSLFLEYAARILDMTKPSPFLVLYTDKMDRTGDPVEFLIQHQHFLTIQSLRLHMPFRIRDTKIYPYLLIFEQILNGEPIPNTRLIGLNQWLSPYYSKNETLSQQLAGLLSGDSLEIRVI